MKYETWGFEVGDAAIMFHGDKPPLHGTVTKISPSGQITVTSKAGVAKRFLGGHGHEVGGGYSRWSYGYHLVGKDSQTKRLAECGAYWARKEFARRAAAGLEGLASSASRCKSCGMSDEDRTLLLVNLRELMSNLEAESRTIPPENE